MIHKLTCSEEMKTEDIPVEEWQKLADWVKEVLMMQAAECAREFEKLPIIKMWKFSGISCILAYGIIIIKQLPKDAVAKQITGRMENK